MLGLVFLTSPACTRSTPEPAAPRAAEATKAPAPAPAPAAPSTTVPVPSPETPEVNESLAPLPTLAPPDVERWRAAVAKIQELRGSAGRIEVPSELRHYEDTRRFLAVQMADARVGGFELPHDQGALARMILKGEMVDLQPLAADYLLYNLGTDAREDPLTHFDVDSGREVRLLPSAEAWDAEKKRLTQEAEGNGPDAAKARARREAMSAAWDDAAQRTALIREHEAVTTLANDWGGQRYDLSNPEDSHRFQVRMLSCVRPEARDMVQGIARRYHEKFGRLLPVTSLVRTLRYQRRLQRVNPNATRVEFPPHATGMAFDISYKFMAPDEQDFLMRDLARLEEEGRVEALRERRNHLHVYTLKNGRPAEGVIAQLLEKVDEARGRRREARAEAPAVTGAGTPVAARR